MVEGSSPSGPIFISFTQKPFLASSDKKGLPCFGQNHHSGPSFSVPLGTVPDSVPPARSALTLLIPRLSTHAQDKSLPQPVKRLTGRLLAKLVPVQFSIAGSSACPSGSILVGACRRTGLASSGPSAVDRRDTVPYPLGRILHDTTTDVLETHADQSEFSGKPKTY